MAIGTFKLPISAAAAPATTGFKVRYFDIDGTILKTEYVASGGNATPPSNPSYDSTRLTFNSWNTSSTNVTRPLDIGAIYDTTDGKTYIFVTVNAVTGLSPTMYINKATTAEMTVSWGDTTTSTSSASGNINFAKTYATAGDYIITISCSGGYKIGNGGSANQIFANGNYRYILKKIYLGGNITLTNAYSFYNNYSLSIVSLPIAITTVSSYSFMNCRSLIHCNIPLATTAIDTTAFYFNYSLRNISISTGVATIGTDNFTSCDSLTSISYSSSVSAISTALHSGCFSLNEIYLPSSILTIGTTAFYNCYALMSISIPASVSVIGSGMFAYTYSCLSYVINNTTPPTLTSDAFTGINQIAKIYVPDASVDAYKAATNWITLANYIYPLSTRI